MERLEGTGQAKTTPAQKSTPVVTGLTCTVCRGPGVIDMPGLTLLSATCTRCGWHFSPARAHAVVERA